MAANAQDAVGRQVEQGGRSTGEVQVRPVTSRRELDLFIKLPWKIYRDDPAWIPPLLMDVRNVLDRGKHPFHEHAEVEYFLAWRDGSAVGRIAAIVNRLHLDFHGDKLGFFGLFEAPDDASVSAALLRAAEAWLRERGMERAQGPQNLSTNEELCSPGVLIEGNDQPPFIMMAHTPAYYARLLEDAGYQKAKDLLAYKVLPNPPERLVKGVERVVRSKAAGLTLRKFNLKDFDADVARMKEVYNSAWERNWGFVPMTDAEFNHLAKQLKPVVDPDYALIAEVGDEPVGFAVALPDYNQAIRHTDGRLFPLGLLKLLWYRRKINQHRVITLGLKPAYRRFGVDAMMYLRMFETSRDLGHAGAEASWILEDNWEMRRGLERMGAWTYKTYRLYEKPLG